MATLPDVLPADALERLAGVRSLLDLVDLAGGTPEHLEGPPRNRYRGSFRPSDVANLTFDPATFRFAVRKGDGTGADVTDGGELDSWLAFPDPRVTYDVTVETDPTHTNATGPFDALVTLPSPVLTLPWLRGAKLDAQGLLVEDLAHPKVRFHLPKLSFRAQRSTATSDVDLKLDSADAGAAAAAPDVYEFCRMEPNHALVGPGTAVGFTFRTAVLDLSELSNPPGKAKSIPADWTGIWLPEARLYVAPSGLNDLAVAAGVEDLWIGFGRHKGVTGLFALDVVNRGSAPDVRMRFHDPAGRYIGTSGTAPNLTAVLPETTTVVVDASGGIAPYTTTIAIGADTVTDTRAPVTTPAAGTVAVTATVTDAGGHTSTVTVTASRTPTPALPPPPGTKPVTLTPGTGANRVEERGQNETGIRLGLREPADDVTWSWDGGGSATGATADVPVGADQTVTVTATRTLTTGTTRTFTAHFFINHPGPSEDGPAGDKHFDYSENPDNTHTTQAVSATDNSWTAGGTPLASAADWAVLRALPAGTTVTIRGFASYDGNDTADAASKNLELSRRRAHGLRHLLKAANPGLSIAENVEADGHATSKADTAAGRPPYWRAVATWTQTTTTTEVTTATLHRDPPDAPAPPVTNPEREPAPPVFPDWFHRVGLRVQLDRGEIVLAEINGRIDIRTAAERAVAANDPAAELPPKPPGGESDGISDFVVRLDLDKGTGSWKVTAAFRAVDADADGLWTLKRPDGEAGRRGLNTLGAIAALGPVLAAVAPESPSGGEYVPLAITGGAATGLAVADVIKTKQLTLHGAEMIVDHAPTGTDVTLLLDLETALAFDAEVVEVSLDKPITTRYKAIGLRMGDRDGAGFQLRPVFDASRGYTLDIPAGAIAAKGPLGDLLKVFGAKVSKDNPTYLEVDVGVGAELGIVRIDRARVRLRLDQPPFELPTLTALGATIEVPGAFTGSGYVEITETGLTGAFDVTIVPLQIRAAAALKLERTDGVLGVFVSVELDLPVPIPLGNSGLGIYGFAAGLGVNMGRKNPTPALAWLENQPNQNALSPVGWGGKPGGWAFAAGLTLGTMDGGFILRMKGLLVLELPGPRVLIVLRARVLAPPPDTSYPLLAAIDIAPDSITIGVLAQYDFAGLVKIRVPVQAFFSFTDPEHWSVDLGTIADPVSVKVLELFSGSGYLMIHGNGINPPPPAFPDVATAGITLAVGFHVQFVWGDTGIGLYLKVAGGFDALVSIDPLFVGGKISISGELRLFIVSIGASAKLDAFTDGRDYAVHGEVCGKVSFFFFDVEGCVDFSINSLTKPPPKAPPLVDGVSLVSRSPALVEGSGTDSAIDGVLTKARQDGTSDPAGDPVPLDAIVVVDFGVTPQVAPGFTTLGAAPIAHPGTPANPWVKRGAHWWRYELVEVALSPLPAPGSTPAAWWTRAPAVDPQEGSRLALLSWVPEAAPRAVPYGEQLVTRTRDRWGGTCRPAAPPVPFLFTFDRQPVGPSVAGWELRGIPWPDDAGTFRSSLDPARLRVSEGWRCGDAPADARRGIDPADVIGSTGSGTTSEPKPPFDQLAKQADRPSGASALAATGLAEATALLADGWSPSELAVALTNENQFRRAQRRDCTARILRSPEGDTGEPSPLGDHSDVKAVELALERTGFRPMDLLDPVLLHLGPTPFVRVLLALSESAFNGGLEFVYLAADGHEVGRDRVQDVTSLGFGDVPGSWWDPARPWREPVERAAKLLAHVADASGRLVGFATLKPPPETVTIAIGVTRDAVKRGDADPFLVAAVEAALASEERRFQHDSHVQSVDQQAVSTVLTQDPDDRALLAPSQPYTVTVRWKAFYVEDDTRPSDPTGGTAAGGVETQTFRFSTLGAAQAPVRLHPWVLDSDPGDAESAAFCDDPVRIVLATQKVTELFDRWGYRLRVVLHGASGRHPNVGAPPTTGSPPAKAAFDPVPLLAGATNVLTPWENALIEVAADLPCVPPSSRSPHPVIELPYLLDPDTNYLLDIVREPKAGGPDALVYRHEFTTSRYRTLRAFAATVHDELPSHRAVPFPAPLRALAARPAGAGLKAAFAAAGLDALGVPRAPGVTVLWEATNPPQPVAVVIDANEPLWRNRLAPHKVTTPPNPQDPAAARWAMRPFEWLSLRAAGTAAVATVVHGPGEQRAVIVLAPNQRGRRLDVALDRPAHPFTGTGAESLPVVSLTFVAAPWEDAG